MLVVDKLKASASAQIAAIDRQHAQLKVKERHLAYGGGVGPDEYAEFSAMCLALVDRVTGRHDAYYEQALREVDRHGSLTSGELAQVLYGLVRSLKRDLDEGWLATFREVEHASVYGDLLELAEWHAGQGRGGVALALVGGVVESHLRLLAAKYDVALTADAGEGGSRVTVGQVNDGLAQVVYGEAERERVRTWLGRGAQVGHRQERAAVFAAQVRDFIAGFPA